MNPRPSSPSRRPCWALAIGLLAAAISASAERTLETRADQRPTACVVDGTYFDDCPFTDDLDTGTGPGGHLIGERPDLGARGGGFIFIPTQIHPGQAFTANAVIENFGGLHFSETAIRVDFYLSPLGEDALLSQNFLGSVDLIFPVVTSATFGEVGVLVPLTGNLPEIAPGPYRLAIDIDVDNALIELNELNNTVAAGNTVTVGGEPDLIPQVAGLTTNSPAEQGQPIVITSAVKNQGQGGIAGPVSFSVRYRAVPPGGDELGGTVLGVVPVNVPAGLSIAGGASRNVPTLTSNVQLPPGDYRIGADVDFVLPVGPDHGAIAEANELNNSGILGSIKIVAPQQGSNVGDYKFRVAELTGQDEDPVSAGDRLIVSVLLDSSTLLVPHHIPPIRIVASEDEHIEVSDSSLFQFGPMSSFFGQPIAIQPITINAPWPVGLPPGSYYVGAIIDPEDIYDEPQDNNFALLGEVEARNRCARMPTLGQAEAVFEEIFQSQRPLPEVPLSNPPIDGDFCTGDLAQDFDYFFHHVDRCFLFVAVHAALEFVEDELLPAMRRHCVANLTGLTLADPREVGRAFVAASRLKTDLARFKALCDGDPTVHSLRRYCSCPNPDFLHWAPAPGPGQCVYQPFPPIPINP